MIYINSEWSFNEIVKHLKTLKEQYQKILASFSYFQVKEKSDFIHETRDKIYSIQCKDWKKDKLWNYMNGCEFYYVIQGIAKRNK